MYVGLSASLWARQTEKQKEKAGLKKSAIAIFSYSNLGDAAKTPTGNTWSHMLPTHTFTDVANQDKGNADIGSSYTKWVVLYLVE